MTRRIVILVAVAVALAAASGCTITRIYGGLPLRGDPKTLVAGESTKGDVLRIFGPPSEIAPQTDGDVFVYRYDRANSATLSLEEPVFTNMTVFQFTRSVARRDKLYILFDYNGVVRGYGERMETEDMPML